MIYDETQKDLGKFLEFNLSPDRIDQCALNLNGIEMPRTKVLTQGLFMEIHRVRDVEFIALVRVTHTAGYGDRIYTKDEFKALQQVDVEKL